MDIKFDNKVNTGQLLALLSALAVLIGIYYEQGNRDTLQESAILSETQAREAADILISERMERLGVVLTKLENNVKLNSEHRLRDEEHWER